VWECGEWGSVGRIRYYRYAFTLYPSFPKA
jgi:hypothetical protein